MQNLSTITISPPPLPAPPPPLGIIIPTPLSYEFRVVEIEDASGKVVKVELQVKVNQHDQYGNITLHGTWNPVERVRMKETL